ncbi:MAG: putative membrane protein YdjX (TVP38/TMEM64 family) [Candidatus Paceibacteria bacterium]|jgi:uncharacterized membrane protein YdjX (TVP38/TMEM64 family)
MKIKEIVGISAIVILFIAVSILSSTYKDELQMMVSNYGNYGLLVYVLATIVSTVVAPVNTLPLLPLAVSLWGVTVGALLSIIGWTIGGLIAYYIAREYGRPLVSKFVNLEKIEKVELHIPKRNMFWILIGLRVTMPVDLLSYALGLFTKISYRMYFITTLIGVTPFAFVFAYAAGMPIGYQIGVLVFTFTVLLYGLKKMKMYYKGV